MDLLVECVPNFSEGRRDAVVDAIAASAASVEGAWLLDRTSDVDHNRSVLTLAGAPAVVTAAMVAATAAAIGRIDMRAHKGRHPCVGAVDVVPFVPLAGTTLPDCVTLAREFAARIAESFDLPVFLYGAAASRPERRVLSAIRRPGFAGLEASMADPAGRPDFGPPGPHPTAGATIVGARPILIAYNVQLASDDVAAARRIASAIRERDGGLPGVQALGLYLEDLGCAQVSMNVLDHEATPLWRVWEEVARLAALEGVAARDSELIGLVPAAALEEVADHVGSPSGRPAGERHREAADWLRLRDYRPGMVLETRLAQVRHRSEAVGDGATAGGATAART